MSDRDTGGPAFPQAHDDSGSMGMTMRDYFAAHASDGDIEEMRDRIPQVARVTTTGVMPVSKIVTHDLPDNWRQIARWMHADAMLKERAK